MKPSVTRDSSMINVLIRWHNGNTTRTRTEAAVESSDSSAQRHDNRPHCYRLISRWMSPCQIMKTVHHTDLRRENALQQNPFITIILGLLLRIEMVEIGENGSHSPSDFIREISVRMFSWTNLDVSFGILFKYLKNKNVRKNTLYIHITLFSSCKFPLHKDA